MSFGSSPINVWIDFLTFLIHIGNTKDPRSITSKRMKYKTSKIYESESRYEKIICSHPHHSLDFFIGCGSGKKTNQNAVTTDSGKPIQISLLERFSSYDGPSSTLAVLVRLRC
jgi:hypothetical protein